MEPPRYHHLSGSFRLRSISSVLTSGTCRGASQCTNLYGSEKSGNCLSRLSGRTHTTEHLFSVCPSANASAGCASVRVCHLFRGDRRGVAAFCRFPRPAVLLRLSSLLWYFLLFLFLICFPYLTAFLFGDISPERVWAISIARLRRYRRYTCDLSTSSSLTALVWRSYLEGGFVLRCFQHLSLPDAATRRCTWRYNRLTGGLSNTVLSY